MHSVFHIIGAAARKYVIDEELAAAIGQDSNNTSVYNISPSGNSDERLKRHSFGGMTNNSSYSPHLNTQNRPGDCESPRTQNTVKRSSFTTNYVGATSFYKQRIVPVNITEPLVFQVAAPSPLSQQSNTSISGEQLRNEYRIANARSGSKESAHSAGHGNSSQQHSPHNSVHSTHSPYNSVNGSISNTTTLQNVLRSRLVYVYSYLHISVHID